MIWGILGFGSIGIAAVLGMAISAIAATKRAGNQQARGDELAVRLEVALANTKTQSARADDEKERADALDAAIVHAAAAGPIDGAFGRLLQARDDARTRATRRNRAPVVRNAGDEGEPTTALGPDDLLPPGA